ncbi:MAG: hypothetical protein ACI89D_000022 [Bermanella sp.]|jgi:hypothetical protein
MQLLQREVGRGMQAIDGFSWCRQSQFSPGCQACSPTVQTRRCRITHRLSSATPQTPDTTYQKGRHTLHLHAVMSTHSLLICYVRHSVRNPNYNPQLEGQLYGGYLAHLSVGSQNQNDNRN